MSGRPHLVIVGGFLGAGKTSLILAAARELERRGLRSAVVMNDQGESLVDTELARAGGLQAGEVTGGCFCCRFSELIAVTDRLREWSPDVIFAEPVGSCTDLSATILRPILHDFPEVFQLAPLTVLVDPERARELLAPDADPNMAFLFRKQMEEADLVCYTKADVSQPPDSSARRISARTGQGIAAWLDEILYGALSASGAVLDIDYEEYARAEAALAWLNADATFECDPPLSPAMLLGPLVDAIDRRLTAQGIAIVHLKAIDTTPAGSVKAALCANGREPEVEGALDASPVARHRLLLNLRAASAPAPVRAIVEEELQGLNALVLELSLACFSPAAPKPERRLTQNHVQ